MIATRFLTTCLPALALCLAFAARAADTSPAPPSGGGGDIDQTLTRCLDDPDKQSTGGQDECIVDATHAWDARLNASYQALRSELPPSSGPALLAAQRAWLASRDADLKLIIAVYGTVHGTMYAPANANDVMMLTRRRAQTLSYYRADLAYAASGEYRPVDRPVGAKATKGVSASDIDAVTRRIERRLPPASRTVVRASAGKWQAFVSAQNALIAAVCPAGEGAAGTACRAAHVSDEFAARLTQLKGLDGMIGAD